jgi:hypothetical protein
MQMSGDTATRHADESFGCKLQGVGVVRSKFWWNARSNQMTLQGRPASHWPVGKAGITRMGEVRIGNFQRTLSSNILYGARRVMGAEAKVLSHNGPILSRRIWAWEWRLLMFGGKGAVFHKARSQRTKRLDQPMSQVNRFLLGWLHADFGTCRLA